MRHASRLLPLVLLALVPSLCPPARAADEKELRKAAPVVGNRDVQDVIHTTMVETDKALATLDRQFREYAIGAASWREQATGVRDTFELHAAFAYLYIDDIREKNTAEAKRLKELVDYWQQTTGRFLRAKIITAGGAAMELSETLIDDADDLTSYRKFWGKIDSGYIKRARSFPPHYDQLVREIAALGDMDSGLKRLEAKSDLKKRVGHLATGAANLGSAVQGRAKDAASFLAKSDPKDEEQLYKALVEKAWGPSELATIPSYIPESWKKMLGEWSSVMARRYGECIAAHADAVTANRALMDGELFKDVPLFAGRDYDALAEPIRALKDDL